MALINKMVQRRGEVKTVDKNQPANMASVDFFNMPKKKNSKLQNYVVWYNALCEAEKQRVHRIIDGVSPKQSFLNCSLQMSKCTNVKKVTPGRVSDLPIKNLIHLRYIGYDKKIGDMVLKATCFAVCSDEKEKSKDIPGKLDLIVIRSNGDLLKYTGVEVLKQGMNRYYLNFNGYTSFELDKMLLRKYCKGVYEDGQELKDLPQREFMPLQKIIDRDCDINIHKVYDYEAAYYVKGKRIEK